MNATTTPAIEQVDRDALAAEFERAGWTKDARDIRAGLRAGGTEDIFSISALARQRQAFEAREARLREALANIHAARLRQDGSDVGYGWSITRLNEAMNAALPLVGIEPPKWDGKLADRAEPAERMAQRMGLHFEIDPAKIAALGDGK